MSRNAVFIFALLMLFGCKQPCPPGVDVPKGEPALAEVEQMLDEYHRAIEKEGLTAEFKYLDHSSDFFWVPPGYTAALSYDSVRSILEKNAPAIQSITLGWDTLKLFPVSGEVVCYTGVLSSTSTDTAGKTSTSSIIESGTIVKRPEGWKLLCGQSAVLPTHNHQPQQ